jgi:Ser/Thr protein kinase RdoA (MazF antagonist)
MADEDRAPCRPAGADDLLIHQDAHHGNLFITDTGEITVFDFDDAAYGTPTHDVAIALFYWLFVSPRGLRFMDGRRERTLEGVPYLGVPLSDVVS